MTPTISVVVWEDLPVGLRTAQACHAIAQLCRRFPDRLAEFAEARLIYCVATASELHETVAKATFYEFAHAGWFEPDRGDALTAIALAPEGLTLTRKLTLG